MVGYSRSLCFLWICCRTLMCLFCTLKSIHHRHAYPPCIIFFGIRTGWVLEFRIIGGTGLVWFRLLFSALSGLIFDNMCNYGEMSIWALSWIENLLPLLLWLFCSTFSSSKLGLLEKGSISFSPLCSDAQALVTDQNYHIFQIWKYCSFHAKMYFMLVSSKTWLLWIASFILSNKPDKLWSSCVSVPILLKS